MKTCEEDKKPVCEVYLEDLQDSITIDEAMKELLITGVRECVKYSEILLCCEVGISFVDDNRIREINKEFRNIDSPTDVLSFPIIEMEEGRVLSTEGDMNCDENLLILGDIVISLERASKQAAEYGHSLNREIAFLATHGMFHLLGYDHMTKHQEKIMLEKQEEVLAILGLARK